MKKKFKGKRYIVFGAPPLGGGWSDYCVEHNTMLLARREAYHWLMAGYTAQILDQKTNETWVMQFRSEEHT